MDDHTYGGVRPSADYDHAPDHGASNHGGYAAEILISGNGALENVRPFKGRRINRGSNDDFEHGDEIVGSSPAAKALREKVDLYARVDAPVLITGETGVGKELVARRLHAHSAQRCEGGFSPINAGAMPETLAASEFFGHERGAFTGAVADRDGALILADGGVLFLDEIGDMPLSIQTHLLRVIEDGKVTRLGGKTARKVDFRLIAATNVDLRKKVTEGAFRKDLYYRINVLSIDVPPLRERGDDVIEIAEAMIASQKNEALREVKLTPKAADRLKTYAFPGNVRELRNVITRAVIFADKGKILPEHLEFDFEAATGAAGGDMRLEEGKRLITRYLTMKALQSTDGNVKRAAQVLGVARNTMYGLINDLEQECGSDPRRALGEAMRALVNDF